MIAHWDGSCPLVMHMQPADCPPCSNDERRLKQHRCCSTHLTGLSFCAPALPAWLPTALPGPGPGPAVALLLACMRRNCARSESRSSSSLKRRFSSSSRRYSRSPLSKAARICRKGFLQYLLSQVILRYSMSLVAHACKARLEIALSLKIA